MLMGPVTRVISHSDALRRMEVHQRWGVACEAASRLRGIRYTENPGGAAPMARYLLDSILNLAVGPGLIPAEKRGKQAQERSSGSPPQILKEWGAAG